jgi:hypothetical protein
MDVPGRIVYSSIAQSKVPGKIHLQNPDPVPQALVSLGAFSLMKDLIPKIIAA